MRAVIFLLLSFNANFVFAVLSGLYIDNEKDQTVIERDLTRREKLEFEKGMLDFFGLPRKPRKVHRRNVTMSSPAPKFLLEIYNSLDGSELLSNEFNLKSEDIRSVRESDTIMTFLVQKNLVNEVRHEKGRRLWFNVSDVPTGDTLVNAELRLYKLFYDEDDDDDINIDCTVTVYQVSVDNKGEKILDFVDATNITSDYEGWLVFNVTLPLLNWVAFSNLNRGLYISVQKHLKTVHEVHPESMGIISSAVEETIDQQPFMVVFLKNGVKTRRLREAIYRRRKKRDTEFSYNLNPLTSPSAWTLRNCQIQTLYVNFKDLNWSEWIIAPDGYGAYYCSGLCDFPLNAHMNATNHAIVQTLVNLINPSDAPKPCCSPTKLGPLQFLYYVEENITLKKFKNMIVKSCGCN